MLRLGLPIHWYIIRSVMGNRVGSNPTDIILIFWGFGLRMAVIHVE